MVEAFRDELFAKIDRAALRDEKGLPFSNYEKTLQPHWGVVWFELAAGWFALIAANGLIIAISGRGLVLDLGLILCTSLWTGFFLAYLQLFTHEAVHFNIHPKQRTNDLICNFLVSGIMGIDVHIYRRIHWEHHKQLGTPMDTEVSYFDPLNIRWFVDILFGIHLVKVTKARKKWLLIQQGDAEAMNPPKPTVLILALLFHTAYLGLLFWFHQWAAMVSWVGGVFVCFPLFFSLRQLLEHRSESADSSVDYREIAHGAVHRLFGDGLIASNFGAAGFNRHLLHHWNPAISYTRLRELEAYLKKTPCAAYLRAHETTYWKTFWNLFELNWR